MHKETFEMFIEAQERRKASLDAYISLMKDVQDRHGTPAYRSAFKRVIEFLRIHKDSIMYGRNDLQFFMDKYIDLDDLI